LVECRGPRTSLPLLAEVKLHGRRLSLYVSNARRKELARLLEETFARLSFEELPLRVQKAVSRFCRRECLRILIRSHAPQLLDREALHSLSVKARASHAHNVPVNLLSKNHLTSQTDRPKSCRTSELTRHLATCAASRNLIVCCRRVKRNSGATAKKNSETRSDSAGHFPYPGFR
jgi:hypothetical protein